MNARNDTNTNPAISCTTCEAVCCRLEVLLMGDDNVPAHLSAEDQWGGWVMRRLDDGWCAAVDRNTMRCTIYERRPLICREYQMGDSDCISDARKLHEVIGLRRFRCARPVPAPPSPDSTSAAKDVTI